MQLETYGIRQPKLLERKLLKRMGYAGIYFIGWDGDSETDPIKIGIAEDPIARFSNFQCGHWRRLVAHELLWVRSRPHSKDFKVRAVDRFGDPVAMSYDKYGEGYVPVRDIESAIHQSLKRQGFHHTGEWFRGGVGPLVKLAKDAITIGFSHEYLDNASMLRKLKMWMIEAEEAEPRRKPRIDVLNGPTPTPFD